MFSVYQHWDPLKVCIVGRSYPPEFYSWISRSHVRSLFEKIAIETEEDYQNIIKKLQEFNVEVLRPDIPTDKDLLRSASGQWLPPPMTPRDHTVMIGERFYSVLSSLQKMYNAVRQHDWPDCNNWRDWHQLPDQIKEECSKFRGLTPNDTKWFQIEGCYDNIINYINLQGNTVVKDLHHHLVGSSISRIGKDLYFGTESYQQDTTDFQCIISNEFPNNRNHIINTGGHSDGTYCPVCPGLIISLNDVPTYAETFPDWEVVYLPNQSWKAVEPFLQLKQINQGKWWIPGFEHDREVINTVEEWLGHWTGYVEETVFDVNMLIIDPKNVIVFNYNKQVFDALERYGITPHIVPFRHRYFWDGGIHCVTTDLHREGTMQDFFPQRG